MPPTHSPRRFEAPILSRMRSLVTSRSNCAKERRTFSVSLPMLDVVLKDWVTETKETSCSSKSFDELGEVGKGTGEPVDLVDDHDVDSFGPDLIQKALKGWTVERSAGEPTIIEVSGYELPALMCWLLM